MSRSECCGTSEAMHFSVSWVRPLILLLGVAVLFPSLASSLSINLSPPEYADTVLSQGLFSTGIDLTFLKIRLRSLLGRGIKKENSNDTCLTFSYLGMMNGVETNRVCSYKKKKSFEIQI